MLFYYYEPWHMSVIFMTIVFQKYLGSLAKTLYYSMDHNIKHVLDYQSISDILCQQDILLSVNTEVVV